jgi:lysozyme family protein
MQIGFDEIVKLILKHEGGYINHKKDPGGETNFGISKRAYPDVDIKNLTEEEAAAIYRADYWNKIKGDLLPVPIGILILDWAVNSGVSRAVKALQTVVNADADGVLGSRTVAAVVEAYNASPKDVCNAYTHVRQQFVRNILTYNTFGKGWERRIKETHDYAMEHIDV